MLEYQIEICSGPKLRPVRAVTQTSPYSSDDPMNQASLSPTEDAMKASELFTRALEAEGVEHVYFPQVEVVGDIANAVWQITEGITPQEHWSFERFHEVKKAADAHLLEGVDDSRFPIYPQRLVADVPR